MSRNSIHSMMHFSNASSVDLRISSSEQSNNSEKALPLLPGQTATLSSTAESQQQERTNSQGSESDAHFPKSIFLRKQGLRSRALDIFSPRRKDPEEYKQTITAEKRSSGLRSIRNMPSLVSLSSFIREANGPAEPSPTDSEFSTSSHQENSLPAGAESIFSPKASSNAFPTQM